jgi:TPR repeat protein
MTSNGRLLPESAPRQGGNGERVPKPKLKRVWTPIEDAYAAWLAAAREALGSSAAVVRAMQDRLTEADLTTVHKDWASKYGERDWRSSYYAQWEKGRRSVPGKPAIRAALIATVVATVHETPVRAHGWGSFGEVVVALENQRRRSIATTSRDAAAQQKNEQTSNYLAVDPAAARDLDALSLGLGSWAYNNAMPPYIPRTVDADLVDKISSQTRGLTVVVGPPKSGKSRSVHQILQRQHPDALVWWANPRPGALSDIIARIRATPAHHKPAIVVLDDAQLCGVDPTDGLTTTRINALAKISHLVVVVHDTDLADWTRQTIDRTSHSDIPVGSIGATPELVTLLAHHSISYQSTLDAVELVDATTVFETAHTSLDGLDMTRMAEVFASVAQLSKKATSAFTAGGLQAAIVNAAIDATIAFPAGVTLEWLDKLTQTHYRIEEPNKIWKPEYLDVALDWATTGIAPRSPHAIIIRTTPADTYRLLDALTPLLLTPDRDLNQLDKLVLPATALYSIAQWYFKIQNRPAARHWWTLAADLNLASAMFGLGVLAVEDGDRDGARTWYLKAANLNHPKALTILGALAVEDGDRDEARTWYLKAANLNNPDALSNLGVLAAEDGNRDEARTWYLKAANLNYPGALSNLGVLAAKGGNRDEARTWYLKAANLDHPHAMFGLGVLAAKDGNRDEARTWYLKAANLNHPGALFNLGTLAVQDGDRDEARTWYLKAANLRYPKATYVLAVLAAKDGKRDEARTWYLKAAKLNHPEAMFNLGTLAVEDGNRYEARTWWQKAANLNNPDALCNLGVAAREDGNREEARTWFLKAATLNYPKAMFNLGMLAWEDGDRDEARTWWQKAANLNDPDAMFDLGTLVVEDENHRDEARTWWQKAANLDHPEAMFNLGTLAVEDGHREEARTWYLKAANLNDPDAMFNFGLLAWEDGDRDEARTWWQKAASLGSAYAKKALERRNGEEKAVPAS